MSKIHIFGATTLCAAALRKRLSQIDKNFEIINYSRNKQDYEKINLKKVDQFQFKSNKFRDSSIVSFAPIWIFSKFLEDFSINHPISFRKINSIIICSSSSSVTKKYSYSKFDKNLSSKLLRSEDRIIKIANYFNIPCIIIQPTMIYGSIDKYQDENISTLIQIMRKLPFLLIPKSNGYRQPIHAYQLADLVIYFLKDLKEKQNKYLSQKILVGGDLELKYLDMLKLIKANLPKKDFANNCKLLVVNDLFFIICSTLFLFKSLRLYESSLRVFSDLSGFKKYYQIVNSKKSFFPIEPFY